MKGVTGWFLQRLTGVLLLGGLLTHFMLLHYSGPEQLTPEAVMARLQTPFWLIFNFAFLVAAIYHGFNGLWGVIIEYMSSHKLLNTVRIALIVVALILVAAGIYILAV